MMHVVREGRRFIFHHAPSDTHLEEDVDGARHLHDVLGRAIDEHDEEAAKVADEPADEEKAEEPVKEEEKPAENQ